MLDFVFILIFPNDFLFFYIGFISYFCFWFIWELFNGFYSNFVYSIFDQRFNYYINSSHISICNFNSYYLFYRSIYI